MRRLALILATLLLAHAAHAQSSLPLTGVGYLPAVVAAVPTFVSGRSNEVSGAVGITSPAQMGTQSNSGTGFCPTLTYCAYFPQAVLSGNLVVVSFAFQSGTGSTFTVKIGSQTMTAGPVTTTAENTELLASYYLCNDTAADREVTILSSAAVIIYHVFLGQYNNVATSGCLDTSNKNSGATSTTFTAGSITPAQSGDLLVMDACAGGTRARTSFTAGSQANITWAKRASDLQDGCTEQWGVYNSTSAINPQLTTAPTSTFLATTMAFKPASAGTAPTGEYVVYLNSVDDYAGTTAYHIDFPSTGNLKAIMFNGVQLGTTQVVTSITDSTNTWVNAGSDYENVTNGGTGPETGGSQNGMWYVANAAADTTGALTINASTGVNALFALFDIAGAATTNPLVTRFVHSGDQTTGANTNVLSNFYPGTANSLVLTNANWYQNSGTSLTAPACGLWGEASFGGQSLNGPSTPDENGHWGVCANSSSSSQTYGMVFLSASANVGGWAAEADSFLASGGTLSGPSYTSLSTNQGTSSASLAVTIPSTVSGDSLVAVIGGVSRTITKVCLDGSTCAAGNSFTQVKVASVAQNCTTGGGNAGDIWYLFSPNTGKTTVTVTYSGSSANTEAAVYKVQNISTFDTANHSNSQTGASNIDTGASITSTGSPSFMVGFIGTSNGVDYNPAQGNTFGYGGTNFSGTGDGVNSLIAAAGTYHFDAHDSGATASYCSTAAAFK